MKRALQRFCLHLALLCGVDARRLQVPRKVETKTRLEVNPGWKVAKHKY